MDVTLVTDEAGIRRCHPLMSLLRPHLGCAAFVSAVQRLQADHGYRLVQLEDGGQLRALAGIRVGEWLHRGRYLEIEELVTAEADRSRGYGRNLLHWIAGYGRDQGCGQLRLVSGLRRTDAHRFYEREGMTCEAKYFSMDLD